MNVFRLIKRLANEFDLLFDKQDYSYLKVNHETYLISIFLGGCSDPEYMRYGGKDKKKRAEKINDFMSSDYFKYQAKGRGGTVVTKKQIKNQMKFIKYIKNINLRKRVEDFNKKILSKIKDKYLVLVSDDESLLHEFIHILFNINKLDFSSINNNWKWNEGLVTYLEHYLTNKKLVPAKDKMNTFYYQYAKKWKTLLNSAKTPREKKQVLKNKYYKLKTKQAR